MKGGTADKKDDICFKRNLSLRAIIRNSRNYTGMHQEEDMNLCGIGVS